LSQSADKILPLF